MKIKIENDPYGLFKYIDVDIEGINYLEDELENARFNLIKRDGAKSIRFAVVEGDK